MFIPKFALTSILAVGSALSVFAQTATTATHTDTLPPAGLASTETAQVNVVNVASNSSSGTAASCSGSVSFLNSSNAAIGAATAFTVTSGQIASVTLPFAKSGLTGIRGEIRPVVTLTRTSGVPCALTFSFETFDTSTGATHIYVAGGDAGFGGREGH